MAVRFILGRAGSGKTRYCLDAVAAGLAQPEVGRRLVLLAPEQATFQMERALALRAPRHGYTRAEVLSFSRLADRVFDEAGGPPELLARHAREMVLRRIVAERRSELPVLCAAAGTQGLYRQLDGLIETLVREGVRAVELDRAAESLVEGPARGKVREIAKLLDAYRVWLGPERVDAAAPLERLRERLEQTTWLHDASIWVDGFAGFTGQELATLVALARIAREVSITLLVDPDAPALKSPTSRADPLDLFRRTAQTHRRLSALLSDSGVAVEPAVILDRDFLPRFRGARDLQRLERDFCALRPTRRSADSSAGLHRDAGATTFGATKHPWGAGVTVRILECRSHREELRQAARFIRTRIADSRGALRFRDFAVIARDLEPFVDTVSGVFDEFELPCFIDRRRPLHTHPLARLIVAMVEAARDALGVGAMTRLLRTGLLPVSTSDAAELQAAVAAKNFRGWEAWRRPRWDDVRGDTLFRTRRRHETETTGGEDERAPRTDLDRGLDAARGQIVVGLEPLERLAAAAKSPTGAAWAQAIWEGFEAWRVRERLGAWIHDARGEQRWESVQIHEQAWNAICDVLGDVHDVLGDTPLGADDLAGVLASALREMSLGLTPPAVDQVLISSIERSRHPEIKCAWVFAFNEGLFPKPPPEEALLSTAERAALAGAGLTALSPRREDVFDERLLAYIAFTRPAHFLTISYATIGNDGSELSPSPLLDEVRAALPGIRTDEPDPDEPPARLTELAERYLGARRLARQPEPAGRGRAARAGDGWAAGVRTRALLGQLVDEIEREPGPGERLRFLLRAMEYDNRPAVIGSFRASPAGMPDVAWDGSCSEVEQYLRCPFQHFANYGLRLLRTRREDTTQRELGVVAHELLADVTRRAMAEPGGVHAIRDERWIELLAAAGEDFWRRQAGDLGARRPDLEFLVRHTLTALLSEVVLAHAARWRRGEFVPLACEQEFAAGDPARLWPPIELTLESGVRATLHGFIDRVDVCDAGATRYLLAYDYKPALSTTKTPYLVGHSLQLFAYLLALRRGAGTERRCQVAGGLLAPLRPNVRALGSKYVAEAPIAEQRMFLFQPRGWLLVDAVRRLDSQHGAGRSPVAAVPMKKGGVEFYRNSDAASAETLDARLLQCEATLLQAVRGIVAGAIEPAPLLEGRALACRNCDLRAVCRFDRAFNPVREAGTSLPVIPAASDAEECEE
jgi:ATP-dependent helicase/nuclease subunit B